MSFIPSVLKMSYIGENGKLTASEMVDPKDAEKILAEFEYKEIEHEDEEEKGGSPANVEA